MQISSIISLLKEYLILGIFAVIVVGILFFIGYKLIYKKLMKGTKNFEKKRLILYGISIVYAVILLGAVFLNRSGLYGNINLQLFSSYKEAYNTMQMSLFRNIVLNILLFVPLGFLLPMYSDKLKKAYKVVGIGLAVTTIIEIIQYITKLGIFEIDDILNNTLGTLIGYSVFMMYTKTKNKENKMSIAKYTIPIAIVPITFIVMFIIYQNQELGNILIQSSYKVNMNKVNIDNRAELSSERENKNIYYKETLSKKDTEKIAKSIFKKVGTSINRHETDIYEDTAIYWNENREYSIWVDFKDGAYKYTDFSFFQKDTKNQVMEKLGATREEVVNALANIGIEIKENAIFEEKENGNYSFKINMEIDGENLINGSLDCTYYEDGKVRRISNNIVEYKKVKEKEIISKEEAYKEITKGKFAYSEEGYGKLKNLTIKDIEIRYILDTKGFYVPIYIFNVIANTEHIEIGIKAIR